LQRFRYIFIVHKNINGPEPPAALLQKNQFELEQIILNNFHNTSNKFHITKEPI